MTATRSPVGGVVVHLPGLPVRLRIDLRTVVVSAVALVLTAAAAVVAVSVGEFPIPLADVVPAVFGYGAPDSHFIVQTLRLPRVLTGVLVGAAFGMGGSLLQSIARNPLASPDLIGITAGAAFAAVAAIVWWHAASGVVALVALGGALLAAVAIYLLAYRQGVVGYRLVLVGIGVHAVLMALVSYLLTRARIEEAQRATVWLAGSLNARSWDHVRPVAIALAVLTPVALLLGGRLRLLALGDDTARGLGVRVEPTRAGLVLVAVALVAVATASAGPIGFVALVAPQIARRLVRSAGANLVPAALVGAALVVVADLVARQAFAPTELPVGVVTGVLGAPYLLYLLARSNRIGAGG